MSQQEDGVYEPPLRVEVIVNWANGPHYLELPIFTQFMRINQRRPILSCFDSLCDSSLQSKVIRNMFVILVKSYSFITRKINYMHTSSVSIRQHSHLNHFLSKSLRFDIWPYSMFLECSHRYGHRGRQALRGYKVGYTDRRIEFWHHQNRRAQLDSLHIFMETIGDTIDWMLTAW